MSKSRAAKRKKQRKQKNHDSKEFQPAFNGYMKMYLGGDTAEELFKRMVCTGDWLTNPERILGKHKKNFKGRKFKVNFYLFDVAGNLGHETARMLDRASIEVLVKTVAQLGNELASHADKPIEISNSCAVIRA